MDPGPLSYVASMSKKQFPSHVNSFTSMAMFGLPMENSKLSLERSNY